MGKLEKISSFPLLPARTGLRFWGVSHYDSQPIPSLSLSNPWGSEPITIKLEYPISPQSKSGGYGGMQTSGYDGSQN